MSASSSVGDFNLNLVKLRKPLEFADGTIQDTAYTGDGSETLAEVLAVDNDALGQDIVGVDNLSLTQISFADGTIQETAYTGSSTLLAYDTEGTQFILTQPTFSATNQDPTTNVPPGLYQATIYFQVINSSNAPVSFDYFNLFIGGGPTGGMLLAQNYTSNFTLANGDILYRNTSLTFVNDTTQNVSFGFATRITSGAFSGQSPSVTKISYILTKLADLP